MKDDMQRSAVVLAEYSTSLRDKQFGEILQTR